MVEADLRAPRTRRRVPERSLRVVCLVLACAPPPLVLSVIDTDLANWQQPLPWVFALLISVLCLVRGEQHPALMDEEPARRAARYSLLVPPLLLLLALLFPYTISWAALWVLSGLLLYLLAYAYVPRVRTAALCVASSLALGLCVLEPAAGGLLAAPALCWLALPALEVSARARLGLYSHTPPRLAWPLGAVLACALLGVGVFAAAFALLPPTQTDYRGVGLLQSASALPTRDLGDAQPPWLELTLLVVAVVVTLFVIGRGLSGGAKDEAELLEPELDGTWSAPAHAPARAAPPTSWSPGPRRALVERYLEHLARLERLGLPASPKDTPAQLAARVPAFLSSDACSLAVAFEAARWTSAPVGPEQLEGAAAAASRIEAALEVGGQGNPSSDVIFPST